MVDSNLRFQKIPANWFFTFHHHSRMMRHVSFLILLAKLFTFLILLQANFLIKINHARRRQVYLVDNAKFKHLIIGMDTLTGLGYDIADIALVSESEMNSYKDGEDLSIGEMSLANKEKFRKHYIPSSSEYSTTMKAEMNPFYSGTKCYENSIFPPEHCDFRLSGFCSTHFLSCAMWESGKFLFPSTTSTSELYETARASKCSNYYSGKFEYGKWVSDDCPVNWFQPEELR